MEQKMTCTQELYCWKHGFRHRNGRTNSWKIIVG